MSSSRQRSPRRQKAAQRIVGIDLGTTHTVVAWCKPRKNAKPQLFEVPQLVAAGEVGGARLFPSNLYAPVEHEQLPDPWKDSPWVVGEHARRRGGEIPARAVSSAKSWLSHAAVDRTAAILPWLGTAEEAQGEDALRLSPVEASMRVLRHVRRAWDQTFPDYPLARQDVVLTVPASFDAAARQLTVKAASDAGLAVRLLEEPQAAFYDYMRRGGEEALEQTLPEGRNASIVLVCDVGGGTTDLSLIRVARAAVNEPCRVERLAVGRHLLLGGDNMDLALAHTCEQRLTKDDERLAPKRFAQLVASCRNAKEQLLAEQGPAELPITLVGGGSRLIGSALRTALTADEVGSSVLDGFFPHVPLSADSPVRRSGIVAFGLPYERDVAITRHLATFLVRHLDDARPDALLLNGGVFRSANIAERLVEVVTAWLEDQDDELGPPPPSGGGDAGDEEDEEALATRRLNALPLADPDAAVAFGAVAYGLALRGLSARIGGGSARGYYIGLEHRGEGGPARGVCVLPRGAEEGVRHRTKRKLALTLGRPVRFELFSAESGGADQAGALIELDAQRFERLPPLVASLPDERAGGTGQVQVVLVAELTAVGTLELACVEAKAEGAPRRFELAFELRGALVRPEAPGGPDGAGDGSDAKQGAAPGAHEPTKGSADSAADPAQRYAAARSRRAAPQQVLSAAGRPGFGYGKRYTEARRAVERVFGKGRQDVPPREVKGLLRNLERILGARLSWTTELNRGLFDALWPMHRARRRSLDHERLFWQLAGFCLRPGIGDPLDPARAEAMMKLFRERLAHQGETRGWTQFWIAWRRVAAGLAEKHQLAIRDAIDPFLAPAEQRLKKAKGFRNDAVGDMLDLAASLERVPAGRRSQLGGWVLERTWTDRDQRLWAALGRIGARVPTYGSVHQVVPARTVGRWVDHLLRERWEELPTAPRAAVALCRVTNDRARDVPDRLRQTVAERLDALDVPDSYRHSVREYVPPTEEDHAAFYGEALPVGLRLVE